MHGDLTVSLDHVTDRDVLARVEDLCARWAHTIDDDRLEELPDLLTPDGRYIVRSRENHDLGLPLSLIYCDGADMLADRVTALRTANIYEPHVYCHSISAIRVLGREADGWRTRCNVMIVRTMADGETCLFASGRCFDHVVEVDGALRFRERLVVIDSRRIDTLLVIPI